MERGVLVLGDLLDLAVQLGGGGLIDAAGVLQTAEAHSLQHAQHAHAVCLDKPVTEFAFEVTNSDLTMPEWASGWGRIHFPPVKLVQE